jgi:DNA polymerase-3 subunit gamma/tau
MPLHIDYRPKNFDEIIGNTQTVNSLKSIVGRADRPRVYLLAGPTGCGKTTIGRILAQELGCPPEIDGDINPDFQEINASNNRGIDTAREIMSSMQYKPLSGKARLYLLDEVHQTTRDFQHAVLKALEDTPEWIYFVLCTTAPEKLLPTIKNRCSKFEVSTLSDRNMGKLLDWILTEEKVTIPDDIEKSIIRAADGCPRQALVMLEKSIIRAADGCPRQALVMLDQIIDLKEEDMMEAIREIEIKEQAVIDLCRALLRGESWKGMKEILKGIDEEPEKVRRAAGCPGLYYQCCIE